MSLPYLPVPTLEHTLESVTTASTALLRHSPERQRSLAEAIDAFGRGNGPTLQEDLEAFARQENAEGRSWLHTEWLRGYHEARTPLPLTTSPGFSLNLPRTPSDDVDAVAATIHAIASVHLDQVRGEFPQVTDARGTDLDMDQFEALAGGLRHPLPGEDEFRRPDSTGASPKEIGVFVDGRLFALTVGDGDARPIPPHAVAVGLARILDLAASPPAGGTAADDTAAGGAATPGGFGGPSYLGSERLAPVLAHLLEDPGNEATYRRLTNLLFTVTVARDGASTTNPGAVGVVQCEPDDDRPLLPTMAEPGRAWVYKPMSYQVDRVRGTWSVHVEHSTFDGGMLVDAVTRIQQASAETAAAGEAAAAETAAATNAALQPQELTWSMDAATTSLVREGLAEVSARAARLKCVRLRLPRLTDDQMPFRLSLDALHQVTLSVAQVLAFSRVRGVYESVDMRTFAGGRTECLRPATGEAEAFAESLVDGDASVEQFQAVLAAHKNLVKACKSGSGFDRHLLGLEMMASRAGMNDPFFTNTELAALRRDFLSTTSLGTPDQVIDYAFAPTVEEGYGVCYTPYPDALGFVVTWWEDTAENPATFLAALERAARLVWDFLDGARQDDAA